MVRVSYNKVVDVHTVFVEAVGMPQALDEAEERLRAAGVLPSQARLGSVQLVELRMPDDVGTLLPTLELVERYGFNITYLDAKSTDDANRVVQIGLYVSDQDQLARFVEESNRRCPTRLREFDPTLQVLDNNLFYVAFGREMRQKFVLSDAEERLVVVNANRIVQNLERTGTNP